MGNDYNKIVNQYVDEKVTDAITTLINTANKKEMLKAADVVALAFGSSSALFTKETSDFEEKLVLSFQKNLTLLIQKTWVEKEDADLKEQVLYKLSEYCKCVSKSKWKSAYSNFLQIIGDVVYLMFGSQTKSDDFVEYALRIDPEFGIFWAYIKNLPESFDWEDEKLRVIMLLGMYFLANY